MSGENDEVPAYLDRLRLDGHGYVVLGAGAGIGRQTAHALSQAGAHVLCVDRDPQLADAVASEVGGASASGDITVRDDVERIFREARERVGPVRGIVDVVGVAYQQPLAETDDATWRLQFATVLDHAFLALQVGGAAIAEAGGGAMVFVGSMSGELRVENQTAYGTAKAALHHLVECAGSELAPSGVRVNAVAPSFVRTPRLVEMLGERQWERIDARIPRGSAAVPAEIAGPILFLCSDLASYVTGQVLAADGGMSHTLPSLFGGVD